jgi:hypothetical protein
MEPLDFDDALSPEAIVPVESAAAVNGSASPRIGDDDVTAWIGLLTPTLEAGPGADDNGGNGGNRRRV